MSQPRLPWEPTYVPPALDGDLLQAITAMAEGAVATGTQLATSLGSQVAGQVAGPAAAQAVQDVGAAAQAAEGVVEDVASAVLPTVVPPSGASTPGAQTSSSTPGGSWVQAIETAAASTAEVALKSALPAVQDRVAHAAERILAQELGKALGSEEPPLATLPTGSDLKRVDAWERAARTFLSGLAVTILAAIVQVVGSLATDGTHVDFFHQDGWKAVGTLAVGAVVTAVSSYVMRYLKEPVGAAVDSSAKS